MDVSKLLPRAHRHDRSLRVSSDHLRCVCCGPTTITRTKVYVTVALYSPPCGPGEMGRCLSLAPSAHSGPKDSGGMAPPVTHHALSRPRIGVWRTVYSLMKMKQWCYCIVGVKSKYLRFHLLVESSFSTGHSIHSLRHERIKQIALCLKFRQKVADH